MHALRHQAFMLAKQNFESLNQFEWKPPAGSMCITSDNQCIGTEPQKNPAHPESLAILMPEIPGWAAENQK